MKIVDMKVRCVAIPMNCMLRHNTGVHPGYLLRTILELITDEGIVGLGEVGGGDSRAALLKLKPHYRNEPDGPGGYQDESSEKYLLYLQFPFVWCNRDSLFGHYGESV